MSEIVAHLLRDVWTGIIEEFENYPKNLRMFWHEDDFMLHLGHRLIVQLNKKEEFDVHVSVKMQPNLFRDRLEKALEKALPMIQKYRKNEGNYVDLVVNRWQDVSNPFLLCAELKYWYYERNPDELREKVERDLKRLVIIKREKVAEQIACLILNAQYDPEVKWICELKRKLEYYKRKVGLINLIYP